MKRLVEKLEETFSKYREFGPTANDRHSGDADCLTCQRWQREHGLRAVGRCPCLVSKVHSGNADCFLCEVERHYRLRSDGQYPCLSDVVDKEKP